MWTLELKTGLYYYWRLWIEKEQKFIFNCTKDCFPPTNNAGYYNLKALMSLKGDI